MRCNKNQPSMIGSSETIREASQQTKFHFEQYKQLGQPTHLTLVDTNFLEWFIGFSEGDGSFCLSQLSFVINQKDPKLLFRIKKKLGFGSVYETSITGIWRYSVTGQKNCLRLYYLFNGHLVLNKTKQRFIVWSDNLILKKHSLKKTSMIISLNTGWLAGFIEAEGGFSARIRKQKKFKTGFQLQKKFYITQKNEPEHLKQIGKLLKSTSIIYCFSQNGNQYHRIEVSGFDSHQILLDYLNLYPCFGQKNIAIQKWNKIHRRQKKKEHLTLLGLKKIRLLCFHLSKFNNLFS